MIIQFCSDLHLEFDHNRKWLKNNPLIPSGDILLVAGDTYNLGRDYAELEFIKTVSDQFESVYIIPGNHEYYGGYDFKNAGDTMNEKILSNVHMVNNVTVNIEDSKLIFTTLWSKIEKHIIPVMRGMMDFEMIKYNGNRINVNVYNEIHDKCMKFLGSEIARSGKKIVVTHHLPSHECNVNEFKNSILNEAFCIDLTKIIENSNIAHWIYGHSHRNKNDFEINNTIMTTNQLGYVDLNEHSKFLTDKILN